MKYFHALAASETLQKRRLIGGLIVRKALFQARFSALHGARFVPEENRIGAPPSFLYPFRSSTSPIWRRNRQTAFAGQI
jgi:hypothetical protein